MDIHGYIHGYPQKTCGYGYGYGWEISYPRQAWKSCFWRELQTMQQVTKCSFFLQCSRIDCKTARTSNAGSSSRRASPVTLMKTTLPHNFPFSFNSWPPPTYPAFLATSHNNYWSSDYENFTRNVSVDRKNWLNFGSHPHLDPDPGILLICKMAAFFHNVAHISGNTNRIFMQIISSMYRCIFE